jgi:hypothetical protein
LAEVLVDDQNAPKSRIVKQIKEMETQRSVAQKIWYIRGKTREGRTTLVTVEQPGGGTRDFVKQADIEREILRNNEEKFQQSHHRPFYKHPLKDHFGFKGLTQHSKRVLSGVYELEATIPVDEANLLAALYRLDGIMALSSKQMQIKIEDYKAFW